MPIPENPQSRSEQYLNAIATGDNSGLPEFPQSRMEQYLEVIAQNGGGGGGGGGVLVVNASTDEAGTTITLDKTWQEIQDAPFTIVKAALSGTTFFYYVSDIEQSESGYYILCEVLNEPNASIYLYTDSPAGYPIYHRD